MSGIHLKTQGQHHWTSLPNWVNLQGYWPKDRRLTKAEKDVLENLHMHTFGNSATFVAFVTIAAETGFSPRQVIYAVSRLEALELIAVERWEERKGRKQRDGETQHRSNDYAVALEPPAWLEPHLAASGTKMWRSSAQPASQPADPLTVQWVAQSSPETTMQPIAQSNAEEGADYATHCTPTMQPIAPEEDIVNKTVKDSRHSRPLTNKVDADLVDQTVQPRASPAAHLNDEQRTMYEQIVSWLADYYACPIDAQDETWAAEVAVWINPAQLERLQRIARDGRKQNRGKAVQPEYLVKTANYLKRDGEGQGKHSKKQGEEHGQYASRKPNPAKRSRYDFDDGGLPPLQLRRGRH